MKKQDKDIGITKIYLVTNCYNDPNKVYIGKTKNHGSIRKSLHKKKYGSNIVFTIIDQIESLDHKLWKPLESYWIEQFRQWGFEIMNINKSGGQGPGIYSEEIKSKMRKPRNNFTKGEKHGLFGQKKTKTHVKNMCTEQRAKNISNSRKGNKYPKASESQKGKKMPNHTLETKNKIGKGHEKPIIQFDKQGNFIAEWESMIKAAIYLNRNPSAISLVCNNKQKTAFGFIWKYKEI